MWAFQYQVLLEKFGEGCESPDFLVCHPMFSSGYNGPERHRVTYFHCAGTETAMIEEETEAFRPCAARFVAKVTAFGCIHNQSLWPGKEVFENDVGNREASGLEIFHILLDQKVPRYRREDANDFAGVNVGDFRILERVTDLNGRLVDSFLPLDDHQTC